MEYTPKAVSEYKLIPDKVKNVLNRPLNKDKALNHWRTRLVSFVEEERTGTTSEYSKEFSDTFSLTDKINYCSKMISEIIEETK